MRLTWSAVWAAVVAQHGLGETGLPSVQVLRVLALFGVLRSLGGTTGAVFLALGRPDIRTEIQLGQRIVFAATIYPFARVMGLVGVALAATLQALIFTVYAIWRTARLVDLEFHRVVPTLAGPMACTAGLFAIVHALRSTVLDAMAIPTLRLLGTLGSLGVVALIALADRGTGGGDRGGAGGGHGPPDRAWSPKRRPGSVWRPLGAALKMCSRPASSASAVTSSCFPSSRRQSPNAMLSSIVASNLTGCWPRYAM